MPLQDDYRVRLASFEGPLDLLLFLVRRHEVDVNDIPIHTLTGQYLDFLRQIDDIEDIDVDLAGEFLVMAATLIEIKSRSLAPKRDGAAVGDGTGESDSRDPHDPHDPHDQHDPLDPRAELVRQLIEYQKYRGAASDLDSMRREHAARSEASGGALPGLAPDEDPPIDVEDAHVLDLLRAYERIVAAVDFSKLGEHRIEYDDTPISLYEADLVDQLGRLPERKTTLVDLFRGRRRSEMIGLFLALLELVRNQRVRVDQPRPDDVLNLELVV